MIRTPKFRIGTKFKHYARKHNNELTIIDIYTTYNDAGDVVKFTYVCSHEFLGQTVIDYDINEVTIARSLPAPCYFLIGSV
jgi:lysyl-tRNA synthetase class II